MGINYTMQNNYKSWFVVNLMLVIISFMSLFIQYKYMNELKCSEVINNFKPYNTTDVSTNSYQCDHQFDPYIPVMSISLLSLMIGLIQLLHHRNKLKKYEQRLNETVIV